MDTMIDWATKCFMPAKTFLQDFDRELILSFQMGLGLGVLVMSTLIIFPGRAVECSEESADGEHSLDKRHRDDGNNNNNKSSQIKAQQRQTTGKFSPPPDQDDYFSARTPHQNMNALVYILLFLIGAIVLDRLYGGFISLFLKVYFPREATLLGYDPI